MKVCWLTSYLISWTVYNIKVAFPRKSWVNNTGGSIKQKLGIQFEFLNVKMF